ncbi:MAG: hypothetical protein RBR66_04360, partial [Candidatus Izemoplasmatales bacterium]|nr:hypothetical protein [Candidatus Izemoplasmatales bacterium]
MNKEFKVLARPYQVWLGILVFIPIIAMIFISFSNLDSSVTFADIAISFSHFKLLLESSTLVAFRNSLVFATATTLISMVLGYFIAYEIKKSKIKNKFVLLTVIILPM